MFKTPTKKSPPLSLVQATRTKQRLQRAPNTAKSSKGALDTSVASEAVPLFSCTKRTENMALLTLPLVASRHMAGSKIHRNTQAFFLDAQKRGKDESYTEQPKKNPQKSSASEVSFVFPKQHLTGNVTIFPSLKSNPQPGISVKKRA